METPSSSSAGFTNATALKSGCVNDGLITKEATDNGSSQDRDRCGKSHSLGLLCPPPGLNPSRDGDSPRGVCQLFSKKKIRGQQVNYLR